MSNSVEKNDEFVLPAEVLAEIDKIIERYPTLDSALMPCIWAIMDEVGYVSDPGSEFLADKLSLSKARVYEVLSFYTMFRTEPQADYVLQVCHNISCHVLGARNIIAHLEKRLGIRIGETTPDGVFALEGAECLGACGHGPCLLLGKHLYEFLTPEKVDSLLESFRKGVIPAADTDRELEA